MLQMEASSMHSVNVKAREARSDDIVVRGNPATREQNVCSSADIKFKKK